MGPAGLRDECLNGEIFFSLKEAAVVIEQWRKQHDPTALIAELPVPGTANIGADTAASGSERSDAVVSIPLVQNYTSGIHVYMAGRDAVVAELSLRQLISEAIFRSSYSKSE